VKAYSAMTTSITGDTGQGLITYGKKYSSGTVPFVHGARKSSTHLKYKLITRKHVHGSKIQRMQTAWKTCKYSAPDTTELRPRLI